MTAVSKFLFDNDFDAEGAAPARARKEPPRKITQAELDAEKAASFEAGIAAGRAEAAKETERRAAEALETMRERLAQAAAEEARRHETRHRESVAAAVEIVRRMLPALARREALAEVESLIAECLARLHDEPRLVVRVADELLDPLRERINRLAAASGYDGRIVLLADPALSGTDARIEWADGGADRDAGAVWQEIEAAVARFIKGSPDAGSSTGNQEP